MGTSRSSVSREGLRFIVVGAANTICGLTIIYALMWMFGVDELLANFLGYATGLALSFVMNSQWTFRSERKLASSAPRFLLVVAAAYAANLAAVTMSLWIFGADPYLAQAAGVAPYAVVTFLGSKYFAFAVDGSGRRNGRAPMA